MQKEAKQKKVIGILSLVILLLTIPFIFPTGFQYDNRKVPNLNTENPSTLTIISGNGTSSGNFTYDYNQTIPSIAYTNAVVSANNASWISTFNATYALFAYNQSSAVNVSIFNQTYAMFAYNQSDFVFLQIANQNASWISTFNATYAPFAYNESTIVFLQISNQNASWISTFNSTYALFAYNQTNLSFYNQSYALRTELNSNITQINANILANQSLKADVIWGYNQSAIVFTQIANQNASWISTFNSTYDALSLYAYNQSTIVFTQIANQNASWISTYNATYAPFAYNQSQPNQSYNYNETIISNLFTDLSIKNLSVLTAVGSANFNNTITNYLSNLTIYGYNQSTGTPFTTFGNVIYQNNLALNVTIGQNSSLLTSAPSRPLQLNDSKSTDSGTTPQSASFLINRLNSGVVFGAKQGGNEFSLYEDSTNVYLIHQVVGSAGIGAYDFRVGGSGTQMLLNRTMLLINANLTVASASRIGLGTFAKSSLFEINGSTTSGFPSINVSGILYVNNSNVGILTGNPSAQLDVRGNATISENLTVSNFFYVLPGITVKKIGIGTSIPNSIVDIQPNGLTPFILTLGTQLGINYTFSSPLPISGAGAGNLRITDDANTLIMTFENNSGNVGIGNQFPLERLHVTGNERVTQNITFNGLKIFNSTKGSSLDSCTLASGACNIYNPSINQASSVIFCEGQSGTLNVGTPQVSARNASGYTVTSSNVLDARWVSCIVIYPV